MPQPRIIPKIGLALSGGAARGIAHVGVLANQIDPPRRVGGVLSHLDKSIVFGLWSLVFGLW